MSSDPLSALFPAGDEMVVSVGFNKTIVSVTGITSFEPAFNALRLIADTMELQSIALTQVDDRPPSLFQVAGAATYDSVEDRLEFDHGFNDFTDL